MTGERGGVAKGDYGGDWGTGGLGFEVGDWGLGTGVEVGTGVQVGTWVQVGTGGLGLRCGTGVEGGLGTGVEVGTGDWGLGTRD